MCKTDKAVNAGVDNSTGIEFQKHCALLFIIEDFEKLKNEDYFLSIEHHDDVLFCYRDGNNDIRFIDTYQAKKSSVEWGVKDQLLNAIKNITIVGDRLSNENFPKAQSYSHKLCFITNSSIKLHNGKSGSDRITEIISERNKEVHFESLHNEIQNNIISKIGINDFSTKNELSNMYLSYVDLPKTSEQQLAVIIGRCETLLGDKISDSKAAVNTLLKLFRKVETTFNQGNIASILDKSKRVESNDINEAFNIITTQKRAYEFWRKKADVIIDDLDLFVSEQRLFVSYFKDSFDLFKDLDQGEYHRIYKFVESNMSVNSEFRKETDCIKALCERFLTSKDSQLSETEIKAAIYAAYVELGDIGVY